MKKLIISLAILASVAFSANKITVLDICNDKTCYTQILENVKSWEWKTDKDGNKFFRIYFYDKKVLDINGRELTVKKRK